MEILQIGECGGMRFQQGDLMQIETHLKSEFMGVFVGFRHSLFFTHPQLLLSIRAGNYDTKGIRISFHKIRSITLLNKGKQFNG